MEKLSRVKKYEDLRKTIESSSDVNTADANAPYADRLNDINPALFKKMDIKDEETHAPERERRDSYFNDDIETPISSFKNEYLDDFINEVREYNIKKGNRENENTQIDILHQLNNVKRNKRASYVEDIRDDISESPQAGNEASLSKDEIARQVQDLLHEDVVSPTPVQKQETYIRGMEHTARPAAKNQSDLLNGADLRPFSIGSIDYQEVNNNHKEMSLDKTQQVSKEAFVQPQQRKQMPNYDQQPQASLKTSPRSQSVKQPKEQRSAAVVDENEKLIHHKLVEETQQLRVQLNEYEGELTDLNDGLDKTNKTLNLILCLLIFALIAIIGVVVYWIVQAGGIL